MSHIARVPSWSITLIDETSSSALMRGSLAAGTSADAALAYVTALASAVAPITDCAIVRAAVSYRITIDPSSNPTPGARSADQALFVFDTDDPPVTAVVSVAGILRSKLSTVSCFGGVDIDLADSDIAAFTTEVSGGIWTDPFALDLAAVNTAYIRQVR
jgi:hypothetical protein